VRPIHTKWLGFATVLTLIAGVAIAGRAVRSDWPSDTTPAAAEPALVPSAAMPQPTPTAVAMEGNGRLNAAVADMASPPRFACDRTDTPGKGWVLAIYAHQPGKDNYNAALGMIRHALFETDQTYDASARRFGTSRRIRYAQDSSCTPLVANVEISGDKQWIDQYWGQFARQSSAVQGLKPRKDRMKMLFFADDGVSGDCKGGGSDASLAGGQVWMARWCWGEAGLTHEFGHTFGLSHCGNGTINPIGDDPMCRNSGGLPECTSDAGANYFLDSCRTDGFRYFEPTPQGKPPLEKHRNVAFSPYLITDQSSKPLNFRMQVVGTAECLTPARGSVVLGRCQAVPQQVWQRQLDRDGYVTLRNLGTGLCLQMTTTPAEKTAAVVTAPCVAGKQAQQWVPQEGTNFANRTGGLAGSATLATEAGGTADGTVVVRGGQTTFVTDYAVTQAPRA
jgi:hypothetical protein